MARFRVLILLALMQALRIFPLLVGLYEQSNSNKAIDFFDKNLDDKTPVNSLYKYNVFKDIEKCIDLVKDPPNSPLGECKYPWEEGYDPVCYKTLQNCRKIIFNAKEMGKKELLHVPPIEQMFTNVIRCNMDGEGRDVCNGQYKDCTDNHISKIKSGFEKGSYKDDYLAGLSIAFIISIFFDKANIGSYKGLNKEALPILGALSFSLLLAEAIPYQPKETRDGYLSAYLRESLDIFPDLSREAIKDILDYAKGADDKAEDCFKISLAALFLGFFYFAICRIRDCAQRSRARNDESSGVRREADFEMANLSPISREWEVVMGLPPLELSQRDGPSAPYNYIRGVTVAPLDPTRPLDPTQQGHQGSR